MILSFKCNYYKKYGNFFYKKCSHLYSWNDALNIFLLVSCIKYYSMRTRVDYEAGKKWLGTASTDLLR